MPEGFGVSDLVEPLRRAYASAEENLDLVRSIFTAREQGDYGSAEWAESGRVRSPTSA